MKRPNGRKADSGAPIFAAISAIGFKRAARAISMSDAMNQYLPLDPPSGRHKRSATNRLARLFWQARIVTMNGAHAYKPGTSSSHRGAIANRARGTWPMIKSRLAVFTVLSIIAYLGLAIAGAGGPGRFFSYPPLIAISIVTIVLGVASLFSEGHIGSGVREDRSNRWVVAVLGVLGIIDGYLPAYTDRIDFLTFGGEGVRWLGVLLYAAGGVVRLAPVFVLGRRFSGLVAIQPEHRLVTGGLYGIIRHPSYLGLFVLMLGWGLAFRSGVGVVIAVLSLGVLLARIRAEERLLSETFGAEYDAYRARTWRLIPHVY
jgi:protein-S-isoprenylcysteine O-methyltransferase Ste14